MATAMLNRSRKLRFFKWAGLVGCVVLVGAWISNLWWYYGVLAWGTSFGFGEGCIVSEADIQATHGLQFELIRSRGILWLPIVRSFASGSGFEVFVPNWMFLAILLPVTIWLWRRDRRIPPGHCKSCGYNLTGNISGTCPECGAGFEKSSKPQAVPARRDESRDTSH